MSNKVKVYYERKVSRGWVVAYKGVELTDPMPKDLVEQKIQMQQNVLLGLEPKEVFW